MPHINPQVSELLRQPELMVGTVLGGKYQIDGVLGSGGMGVVLSATHLELGAPVAIKVVREEFALNEEVVARMLFEARAAAKLRGSHVVRVVDVARLESGAPYIVMEHLIGRDLAAVLTERGALPIQEAVDYLLQACEGLAEAHSLGIIHRDLKPENLFLASTPEGVVVKILDFGISKEINPAGRIGPRTALTTAGCAVGSPYYMSPEQMRASLKVDTRADIWSLGAILFELLTGRCPFEGDTVPMIHASVLNDAAPSLQSFSQNAPEHLDAIVQCCLQKEPALRFESVAELAAALREFASNEGQRSMDRSARLASGINLKGNGGSAKNAQLEVHTLSACSSPTLQAVLNNTPAPSRAVAYAVPNIAAPHRKRWGVVAALATGVVLVAAAVAVWQRPGALTGTKEPTAAMVVPAPAKAEAPSPLPAPAAIAQLRNEESSAVSPTAPVPPVAPTRAPKPVVKRATPAARVAPAAGAALAAVPSSAASPTEAVRDLPAPKKTRAPASEIEKLGGRY